MKLWERRGMLALLVSAFLLAGPLGCGEAEEGNQDSENADTNTDPDGDGDVDYENLPQRCDVPESPEGVRVPDLEAEIELAAAYDMRMTDFGFDSTSPGANLNSVIDLFLQDQDYNFPIVVLLEMQGIEGVGSLEVRGGAGLKADNDGNYRWDDEYEIPEFAEGTVDAEGNVEVTLPLLNFVATVESEDGALKTLIPIRDLELRGQLRPEAYRECTMMYEGTLTGVVVAEEIEDVRIQLSPGSDGVPLSQVLQTARINYDYSGDGTDDSWLLTASFTASDVSLVD